MKSNRQRASTRKARKPTALELELRLSIRLAKLAKRIAALERELSALKAESHQGLGGRPGLDDPQAAHNRPEGMICSTTPVFHGMYYRI